MKRNIVPYMLGIISLIGIFFLSYFFVHFILPEKFSHSFNDRLTYQLQYTQNRHNNEIVIIKIDDRTLDNFGRSDLGMFSIDKGAYAELIEKIFSQYDAASLGIDIVFANPSVLGAQDEQKLADALKKYSQRVVIASHSSGNPVPLCQYSEAIHGAIDLENNDTIRHYSLTRGEYPLTRLCPDVQIHPDNSENIASFGYKVLELSQRFAPGFLQNTITSSLEYFQQLEEENFFIDYFHNGEHNSGTLGFRSYSFIDIFEGREQDSQGKDIDLAGKIVLVGEVGTLIHDSHFTPVSSRAKMPGVEIHANAMMTMMSQRYIRELSVLMHLALYSIFALILSLSVFRMRLIYSLGVLIVLCILIMIFGASVFLQGYILNIFLLIFALIFLYSALYLYRYMVTDKAKRKMKRDFSLYVSPDVVDDISQNPESVILKGEEKEMSIFFTDIVGFTSISEHMHPATLLQLLNEYFREMTDIIHENKGTLDKYIGDAVMCFFNAPLDLDNHSYFACKTALAQQKRLRELRASWQKKGYPEIKIRIGIHTGRALHGNIGSRESRVNYTIIGDSVNLASRLESICKSYGISLCVSQDVYERQKDVFYFRELDEISVKGRQQSVKIYQLIGEKTAPLPEKMKSLIEVYSKGLSYYQQGEYAKAKEIWENNSGDPVSNVMSQRCEKLLHGKAELRQGVFVMNHK